MISALERITGELEKHTADMNYAGTDEFNVHTFSRHPFDDSAYDVLQDLSQRIERISNDLCSAEDERQSYASLTPRQQESRTAEFEEMASRGAGGRGARGRMEAGGHRSGDSVGGVAAGGYGARPLQRLR